MKNFFLILVAMVCFGISMKAETVLHTQRVLYTKDRGIAFRTPQTLCTKNGVQLSFYTDGTCNVNGFGGTYSLNYNNSTITIDYTDNNGKPVHVQGNFRMANANYCSIMAFGSSTFQPGLCSRQ